jgi:uncharacterized surface protein with fasciclin (FAS1) repeats
MIAFTSGVQAATVLETLQADGRFTKFLQLTQGSSAWSILQGRGPITVFAPTDEAFNYLPAMVLNNILPATDTASSSAAQTNGPIARDAVATFHVVRGDIRTASLVGRVVEIKTVNGKELKVDGTREGYLTLSTVQPGGVPIGGSTVNAGAVQAPSYISQRDITAENGTIQVINTVLLP